MGMRNQSGIIGKEKLTDQMLGDFRFGSKPLDV